MNLTFLLKETAYVFLLVLFFMISFSSVEAERSIRLRKIRSHITPRHISLSAGLGNGIYAKKYSYGKPIPNYNIKIKNGKNRRNFRTRRNGKKQNGSRTYASRYKNWTYNRNFSGGRNNPRIDNAKVGSYKKRKEPFQFLKEPHYGSPKQKRRIRPQRFNPMQRPLPPKKVNDFDDEYFFPEEAKRGETKYEFESRYPRPKKKRRNPAELEKIPKKPELISKNPYYNDKPLSYKSKLRDSPISYSTFIQHPSESHQEIDEFYEDFDSEHYSKPLIRNKKKRVKKKTNNPRKKNKDEEYYKPFVFEKDQKPESYSPVYLNSDDYEPPVKSKKQTNKLKSSYEASNNDEDFIPHKSILYSKARPQVNNLFSTSDSVSHYNDYKGSTKIQENSQFNPSYSQTWSSVVETTAQPVQYQTEKGFQPQYNYPPQPHPQPTQNLQTQPQNINNQYNYQNKNYVNFQKTKTVTTNAHQSSYYSQPDNSYNTVAYNNNYLNNQLSTSNTNSQTPSQYNYNVYSNSAYSSQPLPTYSQPVSSSSTFHNDITVQKSQPLPTYSQPVSSSSTFHNDITVQKSVPIYDNTETFYSFNNNAYVNNQNSKYYDSDRQKYTNRVSTSHAYKNNEEKSETDDFIKKHQNLYNNGLSGVPIQGDGYAKNNVKKDYDIGYGDFQFDENQ